LSLKSHPLSLWERARVRGHLINYKQIYSLKVCTLTSILENMFQTFSTDYIHVVVFLRERKFL